jgi:chemotaxis protein CheX
MPLDVGLDLHVEDLAQIVASVFTTMMDIAIVPAAIPLPGPSGLVTSVVYLTGTWQGAVLFHCAHRQACEFAGSFLGMPPPAALTDEVRDTLGELANMVAGNLKCTLRPGIKISIPSVVDGEDYSLRICGNYCTTRTAYESAAGPLWVTLMEKQETR